MTSGTAPKTAAALAALMLAGLSPAAAAADAVGTRVVVMLDTSGSFARQAPAAGAKIVQLLDDWSKQRARRNSRTHDEMALLALDAAPDVVYRATLGDIKKAGPGEWRDLVAARKGYAACTDVAAGFRRAVDVFRTSPAAAANYLVVASDLIDEPVDARSLARGRLRCAAARLVPPADMPWQQLAALQVKGFMTWLPTTQSILWQKALAENGLGNAIRVFDDLESGVRNLPAPERSPAAPVAPLIAGGQLRGAAEFAAKAVGTALLTLFAAAVLGFGVMAAVATRRRRRRTAAAPAVANGNAPRPVTGPVPPLRPQRRMPG